MWVFLLTQMFPVAILIVPIYTIMANLGLIDTKASLVIAYCTVAVPFCAWMLRGYFDTIPRELDEAAALDGLGPFGDVLAGDPAAGASGPGGDGVLHVPHRVGRGRVRHRVHAGRRQPTRWAPASSSSSRSSARAGSC